MHLRPRSQYSWGHYGNLKSTEELFHKGVQTAASLLGWRSVAPSPTVARTIRRSVFSYFMKCYKFAPPSPFKKKVISPEKAWHVLDIFYQVLCTYHTQYYIEISFLLMLALLKLKMASLCVIIWRQHPLNDVKEDRHRSRISNRACLQRPQRLGR